MIEIFVDHKIEYFPTGRSLCERPDLARERAH